MLTEPTRIIITHKLDRDVLYRIDYLSMLLARALNQDIKTEDLAAATKAANAAIKQIEDETATATPAVSTQP